MSTAVKDKCDFSWKEDLLSSRSACKNESTVTHDYLEAVSCSLNETYEHFSQPLSRNIEETFKIFFEIWRKETTSLSSTKRMKEHLMFRNIVGMGESVIPVILKQLEQQPDFIFLALHEITGDNPILAEHKGKIKLICDDWIYWGKIKGFI